MPCKSTCTWIILAAISLGLSGCASTGKNSLRIESLESGICQDTMTGTMWQKERSQTLSTIEDARLYAGKSRLGGYNDWRLPTVFELYDLHFINDLKVASNCTMKLEGNFWTDEQDGEGLVGAWEIGDQCDPERQYFKSAKGFVRLVRP